MAQGTTSLPAPPQRAELILAQLTQLPTLPAVATRLLQMTTATDADMHEVVRLIESDPSLSAKILSLVRRAAAGAPADVATVEKAVLLMGFEAVRNAVLTVKVFETFGPGDALPDAAFDRKEFWKHSLAVACAARMLASRVRWSVDPEEAFVCGLLHDMGKIALDACLPKSFDRVVRQADQRRASIADLEKQLLGLDHTVAGRRLAQLWGLPPGIVTSVWLHHHPPESLPQSLSSPATVRIVHLADLIAREQHFGYSGNYLMPETAAEVGGRLGVEPEAIADVQRQLAAQIEERAHLIGLETLTSQAVYLEALAAANEELGRMNATLAASNRRLRVRDRHLQALSQLSATLRAQDAPSKVCLAIARAWRKALTLPVVGVYSQPTGDGICGYAVSKHGGETDDVLALEQAPLPGVRSIRQASAAVMAGGVCLTAEAAEPAVVAAIGPQLGPAPLWVVPLVHERSCVGGVLFAADPTVVAGLADQRDEMEAMAMASALMLAGALTRLAAEQLADELAEASRKLKDAQKALLRERSLSMIAEMAGGAAHELNNPLAVISGRAQMLSAQAQDEQQKKIPDLICQHAQRCSEIVSELMDFAKPPAPKPEKIDVSALLAELRDNWLQRTGWPADAIELHVQGDCPAVFADHAQLLRALDELASNAVQAMETTARRLQINCGFDPADQMVTVIVRDSGCGMSAEVLEHALDPFFSYRLAGRGRGLGLARAFRWLEINHGHLRLDSEAGAGTTAWVSLPASPQA